MLYRLAVDCEYILVCLLRISLLYQRNITKYADSHTCIFDLHVCQRSSSCFYFLSIPWNLPRSCAAVSLPACGCDLGSILLRWLSLLFSCVTPVKFSYICFYSFADDLPAIFRCKRYSDLNHTFHDMANLSDTLFYPFDISQDLCYSIYYCQCYSNLNHTAHHKQRQSKRFFSRFYKSLVNIGNAMVI